MSAVPSVKRRLLREAADGGAPMSEGLDGLVRGYASLFGRTDLSGDRIEPGAFAQTLMKRGAAGIRMLWQHDPSEPIGVWTTIREDRTGLYVEGRLSLGTRRGRDVLALLREKAVDGLSIGFRTRKADKAGGVRRLLEIDLWEVSIVTFPMQEAARVGETRSSPRDIVERFVRGAMRLAGTKPALGH